MSRVLIYDRQGLFLAEMDHVNVERNWVINGVGEAFFDIANIDPKATETILQFGNRAYVMNEKMPDWGGVIDPERSWDGAVIRVKMYAAEEMLKWRDTKEGRKLTGSGGEIFRQLIEIANGEEDLLIRPGNIHSGGTKREETLGKFVYDHVQELANRSGHEFQLKPELDDNGNLYFRADWYESAGEESPVELKEGYNIERTPGTPLYVERGPIYNAITGLGDASTEGTRPRVTRKNVESIAKYGLRSITIVFDGNTMLTTVTENTEAELAKSAFPQKVFTMTALDEGDTYYGLRVGNIYTLRMRTVGFAPDGYGIVIRVRLLGMNYVERVQRVKLVLEEVIEVE